MYVTKLILLTILLYLPQFDKVEGTFNITIQAYGIVPQATKGLDAVQTTVRLKCH